MDEETKETKETNPSPEMVRRFRESCHAIYASFRYIVTVPADPEKDALLPTMSVYNDPFTDEVWIGRAHIEGERTLAQRLIEEKAIDVWMLPRGTGLVRHIRVDFDGLRALPLDLNSYRDEVATDWVVLRKAKCSMPTDVPYDEMPESVRNLRPR